MEDDLEAWSQQMDADGGPAPAKPQPVIDQTKLFGGNAGSFPNSAPLKPDYDTGSERQWNDYREDVAHEMMIDPAKILAYVEQIEKSGSGIGPQELEQLKKMIPMGDIENLTTDLERFQPGLLNRLSNLGLDTATQNDMDQFPANSMPSKLPPAPQPEQTSQGREASWEELVRQNPIYDMMRPSQQRTFTQSGGHEADPNATKRPNVDPYPKKRKPSVRVPVK